LARSYRGLRHHLEAIVVPFEAQHFPGRPARQLVSRARSSGIGLVGAGVMLLVALMGVSAAIGFVLSSRDQARLRDDRAVTRDVRVFQQALVDAETGVRGFVLSGRVEYLEPYVSGLQTIEAQDGAVLAKLDQAPHGAGPSATTMVDGLRHAWAQAIALADDQRLADAQRLLVEQQAKPLMDAVRGTVTRFLADRNTLAEHIDRRIRLEQDLLLIINPLGALVALLGTGFAFWRGAHEARAREIARQEMQTLFSMTEMLQSVADRDDANDVLRATAERLLPGMAGALYVFSNSRDRLDLSTRWGVAGDEAPADHIGPHTCWALKRGKPHLNSPDGLECSHPRLARTTLEIPMAARGELYGMLALSADTPDAAARLAAARPLATAIADAMSLSLSSNALREKLRNQALRDSLTGLYNRRFLEEMLDRLTQDAQRRDVPIGAIMIDLDHFKRLNDQFGHATGDVVLQEVARAIISGLRTTDVACRYGGEELLILLPDCPPEMAVAKAEQLRARIKEVGGGSVGQPVTASFGVAGIPASAAHGADLLAAADAALYRAKQEGRDRVAVAPARSGARVTLMPGARPRDERPPMNHA
jgi:diguanylate cyclase (GGDEF)-like protein